MRFKIAGLWPVAELEKPLEARGRDGSRRYAFGVNRTLDGDSGHEVRGDELRCYWLRSSELPEDERADTPSATYGGGTRG
jgi:hypothetical protein